MVPLILGGAAFGALCWLGSRGGASQPSQGEYGAVTLGMGGRGPGAGAGIASWLGGRSVEKPYTYHSPSSVVTGWSNFEVYGADAELNETMGNIGQFFQSVGLFSPQQRMERLDAKIEAAKSKIEEYTEAASSAQDTAELENIAKKIAMLEQKVDKWSEKRDRAEVQSATFGSLPPLEASTVSMAQSLAEELAASARAVRSQEGQKKRAATVSLVATLDALRALQEKVRGTSVSTQAKAMVDQKTRTANAVFGALNLDKEQVKRARAEVEKIAAKKIAREDSFGAVPPPATPSASSVLRSAALAPAGSWTRRNVLQAGAADAYSRRLSGTATEADFAVLRAARPGITSSLSGPISAGWSHSPWEMGGPPGPSGGDSLDAIAEAAVADLFGGIERPELKRMERVHEDEIVARDIRAR